jgi:hypothetical protein
MKYIRSLGLLAVAAAATMAFAASASADYITTTTGGSTPALNSETLHIATDGGHTIVGNDIAFIRCNWTLLAKIETHTGGTSRDAAEGAISSLTFTGCTDGWHLTTTAPGSIWVDWTSGHNGTIYLDGTRIVATRFNVPCAYETHHTHLGSITGGNPATMHIEAFFPIDIESSSELCGEGDATVDGNFVTTSGVYIANGH